MPSIKLETSAVLTKEQEKTLALQVSKLCADILHKPESVVQVRIESSLTISFGGTVENDSAFIVIAFIGSVSEEQRTLLPGRFGELLAPYGIDPKKIFLRYMGSDASCWGWN
ncbi:MAG: hypothetical protein J6S53_10720 [Lentisphaeria bacterium]|nr:hypothetical protein [Lentisphaeria bacterium]